LARRVVALVGVDGWRLATIGRFAPSPRAPTAPLVVRWYFRLSSRHVGLSDDDPGTPFRVDLDASPPEA
jgi:hypothetical protein